jgi:hypothetical protein
VKTVFAEIEGALVVRRGSMTSVYPRRRRILAASGWRRGVDLADGEAVRWTSPSQHGMRVLGTEPLAPEMEALGAGVREVGLMVAGVVDVTRG